MTQLSFSLAMWRETDGIDCIDDASCELNLHETIRIVSIKTIHINNVDSMEGALIGTVHNNIVGQGLLLVCECFKMSLS